MSRAHREKIMSNSARKNQITLTPLFDTLEHLSARSFPAVYDAYTPPLAPQDYHQATQFLRSYRGSESTFNAYRRDIERFLQWCWLIKKKSLSDIHRDDIEHFIEFCQKPLASWVGHKNVARFIERQGKREVNPEWRPFVNAINSKKSHNTTFQDRKLNQLSQKALQAIFAILSSFYAYLLQEAYVTQNPVAQIRQKSKFLRKYQTAPIVRRLSELQWSYVIETAKQMAQQNPVSHERTLFIMNALYAMYLRISELAASKRWEPQMGHFQQDHDGNWWFITVGKGNKQRMIAVSQDMLEALKRYRRHLNLASLPFRGETTALLAKIKGIGAINSTRQIRHIVQTCFDTAILRLQKDQFYDEAESLKAATVHWLRHTGISEDVKHRPREHVRDDAGHSSSAITDKYIDAELRERHLSARKKKIDPNSVEKT